MHSTPKLSNQTRRHDPHVNGVIQTPYVLSHDPAKETELLGSLLVAPERFADVVPNLHDLDFSDELNAATFKGMRACHDAGLIPTAPRIIERLDRKLFESQKTSPTVFLVGLAQRNDYPGNIPYLVNEISAIGHQRRLQVALHEARIDLDHSESPADVLARLQEAFRNRRDALGLVNCADLADQQLTLAPTIFDRLLRTGETMNIIMATKVGKTWLALYMAICLRLGIDLFDKFAVTPGEVLYVNAEIQKQTFEKRVETVVEALGYRMSDLDGLHLLHLKGKSIDIDGLFARLRDYPPGKFSLVIFDPISRLYAKGSNENDPGSMREPYDKIDAFNDYHGCASIVVHHATKGSQTNKGVTDVGSGSGMISRAADCHFIARAHEEPDTVAVEAALRSFKPLEPFCLRWNFPIWVPAPEADPARLKPDRPTKPKPAEKETEPVVPWTAEKFSAEFVTPEPRKKSVILGAARLANLNATLAESLLDMSVERGLTHRWKVPGSNAAFYANRPQPIPQIEIT